MSSVHDNAQLEKIIKYGHWRDRFNRAEVYFLQELLLAMLSGKADVASGPKAGIFLHKLMIAKPERFEHHTVQKPLHQFFNLCPLLKCGPMSSGNFPLEFNYDHIDKLSVPQKPPPSEKKFQDPPPDQPPGGRPAVRGTILDRLHIDLQVADPDRAFDPEVIKVEITRGTGWHTSLRTSLEVALTSKVALHLLERNLQAQTVGELDPITLQRASYIMKTAYGDHHPSAAYPLDSREVISRCGLLRLERRPSDQGGLDVWMVHLDVGQFVVSDPERERGGEAREGEAEYWAEEAADGGYGREGGRRGGAERLRGVGLEEELGDGEAPVDYQKYTGGLDWEEMMAVIDYGGWREQVADPQTVGDLTSLLRTMAEVAYSGMRPTLLIEDAGRQMYSEHYDSEWPNRESPWEKARHVADVLERCHLLRVRLEGGASGFGTVRMSGEELRRGLRDVEHRARRERPPSPSSRPHSPPPDTRHRSRTPPSPSRRSRKPSSSQPRSPRRHRSRTPSHKRSRSPADHRYPPAKRRSDPYAPDSRPPTRASNGPPPSSEKPLPAFPPGFAPGSATGAPGDPGHKHPARPATPHQHLAANGSLPPPSLLPPHLPPHVQVAPQPVPVNIMPAAAPPGALVAAPGGGLLPMIFPGPTAAPQLLLPPQQPLMVAPQQLAGLLQQLPGGNSLLGGLQAAQLAALSPQAPPYPQQAGQAAALMGALPPNLAQLLLGQQGPASLPALLQQFQHFAQQQQQQFAPGVGALPGGAAGMVPLLQGGSHVDDALRLVLPALPDSLVQLLHHTPLSALVANITVQADARGRVLLTNGASLQTPDASPVTLADVTAKLQALLYPSTPGANPFHATDALALPNSRSTVTAIRDEARAITAIRYDIVRDGPPVTPGAALPPMSSAGAAPLPLGVGGMPVASVGVPAGWAGGVGVPGAWAPQVSGGLPGGQYGAPVGSMPMGAPQQAASETGEGRLSTMPPHLAHLGGPSYSAVATSQPGPVTLAAAAPVQSPTHLDYQQQQQQQFGGAHGAIVASAAGNPAAARPVLMIPNGPGSEAGGGGGGGGVTSPGGNLVSPGGLSEYSTSSLGATQNGNGGRAGHSQWN